MGPVLRHLWACGALSCNSRPYGLSPLARRGQTLSKKVDKLGMLAIPAGGQWPGVVGKDDAEMIFVLRTLRWFDGPSSEVDLVKETFTSTAPQEPVWYPLVVPVFPKRILDYRPNRDDMLLSSHFTRQLTLLYNQKHAEGRTVCRGCQRLTTVTTRHWKLLPRLPRAPVIVRIAIPGL